MKDDPALLSELPVLTVWSQYLNTINEYSACRVLEWIICNGEVSIVTYLQNNWHEILRNSMLVSVLLSSGEFSWRHLPYAAAHCYADYLPKWIILSPAYFYGPRIDDYSAFADLKLEQVWEVLHKLHQLPDGGLNNWHACVLDHLLRTAISVCHKPTIAAIILLLNKYTHGLYSYNTVVPIFVISSGSDKDLFLYVQSLIDCRYDSAVCVDEESPPPFDDIKWFVCNSARLVINYNDIPVYILAQDSVPFQVCCPVEYWNCVVRILRSLTSLGLISHSASPTLTLNHLNSPDELGLYVAAAELGLYDICRALSGWGFNYIAYIKEFDETITDPFEIALQYSSDTPRECIDNVCCVKNIIGASSQWGELIINAICKFGVHPSPLGVYGLADQSPIPCDGHNTHIGGAKKSTLEFIKLIWCLAQDDADDAIERVIIPPMRIRRYLRRRYPEVIAPGSL